MAVLPHLGGRPSAFRVPRAHQGISDYDVLMRTTVTLDPDTAALVQHRMREQGVGFKQAINDALRAGADRTAEPFRTQTADLGVSTVNLDRALRIAADLEDDELVRKLRTGR